MCSAGTAEARIGPIDWALCIASGGLLALAHAPISIWWLAWAALVPALISCRDKSAARRLVLGVVCGGVWGWTLVGVWLWPATGEALGVGTATSFVLTLAAVLMFGGLYVALFLLFWDTLRPRSGLTLPLMAGGFWVTLEIARMHLFGGYPWGLLGHTQWEQTTLIQIADLAGVYGLSFLIAAANVAIAEMLATGKGSLSRRARIASCAVVVTMLAVTVSYGWWRLSEVPSGEKLDLQLVHTAWSEDGTHGGEQLFSELIELTATVPPDAGIVVWPENSIRFYLQTSESARDAIATLVSRRGQYLLAGGPRFTAEGSKWMYYNSAYLLDPSGEIVGLHDKTILVPLAEKALSFLPAVERPFHRGNRPHPLNAGGTLLGVLVCFEAIYPQIARELVRQGAILLVNVTNDQLLAGGAAQQAAMSVFRAVENRVPLVRVSNLGPSLTVDSLGRVTMLATGRAGSATISVNLRSTSSPYSRIGDGFAFLCLAATAAWLMRIAGRTANIRS